MIIWDHNKEAVFTRARSILQGTAKDMVGGIAFHWYSGDHFENLSLCREFFPEKELIFTEGCVELSAGTTMAIKANKDVAGNRLARMTSGKKSIMTLCYECVDGWTE